MADLLTFYNEVVAFIRSLSSHKALRMEFAETETDAGKPALVPPP